MYKQLKKKKERKKIKEKKRWNHPIRIGETKKNLKNQDSLSDLLDNIKSTNIDIGKKYFYICINSERFYFLSEIEMCAKVVALAGLD